MSSPRQTPPLTLIQLSCASFVIRMWHAALRLQSSIPPMARVRAQR
jgi:hypothetical protein